MNGGVVYLQHSQNILVTKNERKVDWKEWHQKYFVGDLCFMGRDELP